MKNKTFLCAMSLISVLVFAMSSIAANQTPQPNVVFFLIDDLGWKDLVSYGAEVYETPNIDALCASGTRFTRAYTSAPVCSPARGAALSGVHSLSIGMYNARHEIPPQTPNLARSLKDAGYTTWHVGKWHMGSAKNKNTPTDIGFDVNIGGFTSYGPGSHFWPYGVTIDENGKKQYNYRNAVPGLYEGGKEGEYLADRLTHEAITLLEERDKTKPFFLNFWHYGVHAKHEAPADLVKKYQKKMAEMGIVQERGRVDPATGTSFVTSESYPVYAGMIDSVDQSVGRIVDWLKKEGLYENTIFVFYSDNGPLTDRVPCVPLMGGKNSTYEAGVRVPAFVTWPGHVPAGKVNDDPVIIMDVMPTILDAVGVEMPSDQRCDGVSLLSVANDMPVKERDFYWYFPDDRYKWGQRANAAILGKNGFKLIMFFDGSKDELYNMTDDIAEEHNVIAQYPEIAEALRGNLLKYMRGNYASLPMPGKKYRKEIDALLGSGG